LNSFMRNPLMGEAIAQDMVSLHEVHMNLSNSHTYGKSQEQGRPA
jgi:hypothetical protein